MAKIRFLFAGLALITAPFYSYGAGIGEGIEWHGFLTSNLAVTSGAGDDVHYTGDLSDEGSAKDTRFGLNLSTRIDDSWRLAAQLKALGTNDFDLLMDWAFASYQASNAAQLNFGRMKYPMGLVNEYIDVGYTYLWIRPPEAIYTQDLVGPNVTRIAYNGFGAKFKTSSENSEFGFDVFSGIVDVEDGHVNKLIGGKFSLNYDDVFRFELAANTGKMEIDSTSVRFMMMDDQRHTTYITGISLDLTHFILYTELAKTKMGAEMMNTDSGYLTLGYRMGQYTPHVTFEKWDVQGGWGQEVITLGLRREITDQSALKFELRQVSPDGGEKPPCMMNMMTMMMACSGGQGLFNGVAESKNISIVAFALEILY